MTNQLFKNFPIITYNGVRAINITQSLNMVANLVSNTQFLSGFTMNEPMRSDQLARVQYSDPTMEWLTWMANGRINPYDWYMNQAQFYDYLNKQYGDYIVCQEKVKYYINNWYSGNDLTVDGFDSLPPELRKYYQPKLNAGGQPVAYLRTQADWIISTNHIVQFNSTIAVPKFIDNEIVTVTYAPGVTAKGQVAASWMSGINIQHVFGTYDYNGVIDPASFSIVGSESGSVLTITNINQMKITIYNTLLPDEYVYYDPVTIFDDENIKNEARKNMYYLPQHYVNQALSDLKRAF